MPFRSGPEPRRAGRGPLRNRRVQVASLAILLAVLVALVWFYRREWFPVAPAPAEKVERDTLAIYVPTHKGRLEKRTVDVARGIAEAERAAAVFAELKRARAIPEKLMLHDCATDAAGVTYINVSREMIEGLSPPFDELTVTYAIVNSLLSCLPDAKRIQFLVEGKAVYTFRGLLYTYAPLGFSRELMEE